MSRVEEIAKVNEIIIGIEKAYKQLIVHEATQEAHYMQVRRKWYLEYKSRLETH